MADPKFSNGDRVRDKVVGLTGIITATTVWLNGCIRYLIQPQEIKDGKPVDNTYFDEGDLILVESSAVETVAKIKKTGGPQTGEAKTRSL